MFKEHLSNDNKGDKKNGDSSEQRGGEGVRGRGRGGQEKREFRQVKADVEQARVGTKLANHVKPEKHVFSRTCKHT